MTRKMRTTHWGRLLTASLLTVCCTAGCGRGPTAPSRSELTNPASTLLSTPSILSVTPSIGSTGGGAAITITGAGLLAGARVAFGATTMGASFYRDRLFVTTPSHEPGSVDVMVTNVDGQNAVAIGAYTFAAPESFDVNGNWRGVSFAGDYDEPFTFTVVNGAVASITCAMSGLVRLSPPAPIIHGEFSFAEENIVAVSGRILAPNEAKGVVNIGLVDSSVRPCVGAEWHATKE
jgi:IPT/TIG domain